MMGIARGSPTRVTTRLRAPLFALRYEFAIEQWLVTFRRSPQRMECDASAGLSTSEACYRRLGHNFDLNTSFWTLAFLPVF